MQNKDLLLYFQSFLSIINKRNPTNIVGYERKVESMSNINISYKELKQLEKGSYQLLDMRDESNTSYGMIPGAVVAAGEDELGTQAKEYIDQGKKVILYCTKGIFSKEAAEKLAEEGIDVLSLEGGYTGWLLSLMKEEQENDQKTEQNNNEAEGKGKKKELTRTQEIDKSIRKKFHKQIFSKIVVVPICFVIFSSFTSCIISLLLPLRTDLVLPNKIQKFLHRLPFGSKVRVIF